MCVHSTDHVQQAVKNRSMVEPALHRRREGRQEDALLRGSAGWVLSLIEFIIVFMYFWLLCVDSRSWIKLWSLPLALASSPSPSSSPSGTCYEEDFMATGFGMHLAMPILRDMWKADMSYDEARSLCESCLKLLFYRDCKASCKIQIATATEKGGYLDFYLTLTIKMTSWKKYQYATGTSVGIRIPIRVG